MVNKMSRRSTVLHFDETGFTGNDLLNKNQPYFCYAGLECDHQEAQEYVEYIIKKYRIQSTELKGRLLLRSENNKKAVLEILQHFKGRYKFTFADKKYALAGKIFEYCFEPLISNKSTLFYKRHFHRVISHIIYISFKAQKLSVIDLYSSFANFIRSGTPLDIMYKESSFIGEILMFIKLNARIIHSKSQHISKDTKKWLLDLTQTSLFTLLESFNNKHKELIVFCDHSKPLADSENLFNRMIGEEKKIYVKFGALRPYSLFVNLKEAINFADSAVVHGIQLADVIAAACNYACNPNNESKFSKKIQNIILEKNICIAPLVPEPHIYSDMTNPNVQMNLLLLKELTRRSREKEDLLENIEFYISFLDHHLKLDPLDKFKAK